MSPPPPAGGLVTAIDVSSNQGLDITPLLTKYAPQHLITKLYQSVELGGIGPRYSVAHAKAARDRGVTVGGYVWLYAGIDGGQQVADALATAQKAGIAFSPTNPLWLDCEDYTDKSFPSLSIISQAVNACQDRRLACGIYTGGWWWTSRAGNSTAFSHLPLWDANYVNEPRLVVPTYGGWDLEHLAGTQWSGALVDRSLFKAEYATP